MALSTSSDPINPQSPGLPFEPFLVFQSPGIYSIAPASWLPFSSSTVGKPQHYHFVLFFMCLLLLSTKSCPSSKSAPPKSQHCLAHVNAQFGLYSGSNCCGLILVQDPSKGRAQNFTNTGECFHIPLSTTKLSQLDENHSNRIMVPLDQLTLGLVACHLFQLVQ